MDFPIQFDTISMGLPIVYFKGSQLEFSKLLDISVPEDCLILAKSAILNHAAFIWVFTVCQITGLGVSSIQRVN